MTVRSFDIILIRDHSRKWHLQHMDLTQSYFESQIFRWNNQNTNLFPFLLFSVAFDFVFQIRSRVENAFGSTCHLDIQTSQTKNKQIISSLLTVQPNTNWLWDHNQLLFQFKIQKKSFQLSFFFLKFCQKVFFLVFVIFPWFDLQPRRFGTTELYNLLLSIQQNIFTSTNL